MPQIRTLEKDLGLRPLRFQDIPNNPHDRAQFLRVYFLTLKERSNSQKKEVRV